MPSRISAWRTLATCVRVPTNAELREPHELVGEAGVLGDHALDLLEARLAIGRDQLGQRAEAVCRRGRAGDHGGLGEEVALEAVEAHRAAGLVLLTRLDLERDQRQPAAAQLVDLLDQRGAGQRADVELDDVGEREQRLQSRRQAEAVERDLEAGVARVAQRAEQRGVGAVGADELEDDPLAAASAAGAP